MIRTPFTRAAIIAGAVALAPLAAFAQTTPTPATASTPAGAAPSLSKEALQRMEQHNKQLHDELGITSAEQPQWDKFAQTMRDNAAGMSQALSERGAKIMSMNADENMKSYAEVAQVHADNMKKAAAAFDALYNDLTPQQKQTADAVFRNHMATKAAAHR
jgi:hypothetical protein